MSDVDCGLCHEKISDEALATEGETGFLVVDGKRVLVHIDCYFDEMGKEVEEHPLGRPSPHGCS